MSLITTSSPLKSWDYLKFWDYYYNDPMFSKVRDWGSDKKIFPHYQNWFKALELTSFDKVKVVLLGQDPYATKGMAHGLAFSVQPSVKSLPPSLRNIFREYCEDTSFPAPRSGDLSKWAKEGVLLLNTILTVEQGKPLSHKNVGWHKLTYEILRSLNDKRGTTDDDSIVFMLWGKAAQEYRALIDNPRHLVLCAAHPSPLNARGGFFGCKHFSKANTFLKDRKIDWRLE